MAFTRSAACRHKKAAGLVRLEPHLGEEKLGFPAGDVRGRGEKSSHSAADEHERKMSLFNDSWLPWASGVGCGGTSPLIRTALYHLTECHTGRRCL